MSGIPNVIVKIVAKSEMILENPFYNFTIMLTLALVPSGVVLGDGHSVAKFLPSQLSVVNVDY